MSSLRRTYSSNKTKPGKTKAFFICILIAAFLWLVHSLNTVYYYTVKVPVSFKNLPQSKKNLTEIPTLLSVHLKASGLKLCLILLSRPFEPVEIDFNSLKSISRSQRYILSSADIDFKKSFKFDAQIKHISPDTLYFSEKTGYQKTVPLKAPLFLKCREGFGYKTPVISPASVTIWGDTSSITTIDTLYTQALDLSDLDRSVSSNLTIIKPGPEVYLSVSEATVTAEVARLVEQSIMVPVIPLYRQADQQVNLYPARVRIKFTSLQNTFDLRDTSLFRVTVNGDKINPLTKKCPVFLNAGPANVTVLSIEPREVEILILKQR